MTNTFTPILKEVCVKCCQSIECYRSGWAFWGIHYTGFLFIEIKFVSRLFQSLKDRFCVLFLLQLVRVLVSPNNPPGATSSCQKAMFQCGLLQQLCTILMATGVPADILTEVSQVMAEATLWKLKSGSLGRTRYQLNEKQQLLTILIC